MKVVSAILILAGLAAVAGDQRELHALRYHRRPRSRKSRSHPKKWYHVRLAGDCGDVQLVLGDDEPETLECAEQVEDKLKEEFVVGVDQDIDTDATDSSYDVDPDDAVTLYVDFDLVDEFGCDVYEEYALDEVDDELREVCEWDKAKRYFRHRPSWRRRYRPRYWRSRSKNRSKNRSRNRYRCKMHYNKKYCKKHPWHGRYRRHTGRSSFSRKYSSSSTSKDTPESSSKDGPTPKSSTSEDGPTPKSSSKDEPSPKSSSKDGPTPKSSSKDEPTPKSSSKDEPTPKSSSKDKPIPKPSSKKPPKPSSKKPQKKDKPKNKPQQKKDKPEKPQQKKKIRAKAQAADVEDLPD